jgi:hypothetical protein
MGTGYYLAVVFALFKLSVVASLYREITTLVFYTVVYMTYFWVFVSDPGIVGLDGARATHLGMISVPGQDDSDPGDIEQPENSFQPYCNTCHVLTDASVAHCVACNTCVRDIDHHCVAFGKCIARKNMPAFRVMLAGVVLSILTLYVQGIQTFRATFR